MTNLSIATSLTPALFGEVSRTLPGIVGIWISGLAVAFAVWQFRIQRDKVRRPNAYFSGESQRDQKFLKRQASRRMQTAVLVGIFGSLMLVGLFMPYARYPKAWAFVWLASLIFLAWAGCLAVVDVISIKLHYGAEVDRQRAEKLALDYKMKKFHEESLNQLDEARKESEDAERSNDDPRQQ